MGLFRKKSNIENSAWANPAHKAQDEAARQQHFQQDKIEFTKSLTSQETSHHHNTGGKTNLELLLDKPDQGTHTHSPSSSYKTNTTSSSAEHVAALERKLRARDESISRMSKAMRAESKVQSERIDLLERELEQLVELSSSECAALQVKNQSQTQQLVELSSSNGECDARQGKSKKRERNINNELEITALRELITRVIAEKDRLEFENGNLKTLLKESSSTCCCDNKKNENKMPSSITELDNLMMRNNPKKQRQEIQTVSPPSKEEKEHKTLFQMSCRNCPQDPKYTGVFTSTKSNRQHELKRKLETHFHLVWKMMQEGVDDLPEGRSVSSMSTLSKGEEETWYDDNNGNTSSSSFPTSSLALHLVRHHCREFKTEKEVMQWCMTNIKVEIQKKGTKSDHHDNDKRRAHDRNKEKKSRSKSSGGGRIKTRQDNGSGSGNKERSRSTRRKEKKVEV